jgi:hypothetical protein
MALLYDPGPFMPTSEGDFEKSSWMLTWDSGPWHLHDVEVGGAVFLVRAGDEQRLVWETRVTHWFAVPYEGLLDLSHEILIRWGLAISTPTMSPGGFCMGWRAEPVARVDREPSPMPDEVGGDDVLGLTGFQQTAHESPAFRRRWGFENEPDTLCSGPKLGWFGND